MSVKSKVSNWKFSTFLENNNNKFNKNDILKVLAKQDMDEAYQIISGWNNYSPTPLISLNKLSKELNIKKIFYKDESKRFHLKSFKALGGAYAVAKVTKGNKEIIVSTATAGNHGRSVAWGSKKLAEKIEDSLNELNNSKEIKEAFGEDVINSFIKLKNMEIEEFNKVETFDKTKKITDWEKQNTLDC